MKKTKSSSILGVPKKAGNIVRNLFTNNKDGKTDLNEKLLSDDEQSMNNDDIENNIQTAKNKEVNNKTEVTNEIEMEKKVSFKNTTANNNNASTTEKQVINVTTNPINKNNKKSNAQKEGYDWDFCIILPNPEFEDFQDLKSREGYILPEEIIERLQLVGLETHQYYSGDWDEIVIKIRAPLSVLRSRATELGDAMTFLLDPNYIKLHIENKRDPIAMDSAYTMISPYDFIYAGYDDEKRSMYTKAKGYNHPFSDIIRIALIMNIITSEGDNCCALNLRKLKCDGTSTILNYFPMHNVSHRDELKRIWLGWKVKPSEQPLEEVKEYLGVKLALYFCFSGHYTTWLVYLIYASAAAICYILVEAIMSGSLDVPLSQGVLIPFFCIFVAVWAQLMLEYWKRLEKRKAMEWGYVGFEEEETERPEYIGDFRKSLIDGKNEKFFDPSELMRRKIIAISITTGLIFGVLICVCAIFFAQYMLTTTSGIILTVGGIGVSIASAVQVVVFNIVYAGIAEQLNDWENYRTDTAYDDALIVKLFVFMFINSYASMYYIAFIKANLGGCKDGSCMVELATQLATLFISQMTVSKFISYFQLVVKAKMKEREEQLEYQKAKKEGREVFDPSEAEKENALEPYNPSTDLIGDYSTMVVQFGFVTLFVAACPIAPMLAYFSNLIEIRLDAYKLLFQFQRVVPVGAEDIGTWMDILQILAFIAVITNCAIVCFTMKVLPYDPLSKTWIFIIMQYTILFAMVLFEALVDDIPEDVEIQLKRQEYLRERSNFTEEMLALKDDPVISRPTHIVTDLNKTRIHRTEKSD